MVCLEFLFYILFFLGGFVLLGVGSLELEPPSPIGCVLSNLINSFLSLMCTLCIIC